MPFQQFEHAALILPNLKAQQATVFIDDIVDTTRGLQDFLNLERECSTQEMIVVGLKFGIMAERTKAALISTSAEEEVAAFSTATKKFQDFPKLANDPERRNKFFTDLIGAYHGLKARTPTVELDFGEKIDTKRKLEKFMPKIERISKELKDLDNDDNDLFLQALVIGEYSQGLLLKLDIPMFDSEALDSWLRDRIFIQIRTAAPEDLPKIFKRLGDSMNVV